MAKHAMQLDFDAFRHAFLPCSSRKIRTRSARRNPFSALDAADDISAPILSERFTKSINDANLTPGFTLSSLSRCSSFGETNGKSTDTAFCRGHYVPRSRRQPSWADQSIPVEFKSHSWGVDPFEDVQLDEEDTAVAIERRELFNHILTTARLLFAVQHRVFLFMFLVIGRRVRLLRWDHAGVLATPSFDYYEQPAELCDLFWRLSHLDDTALGVDPSATRLPPGKDDHLHMDAAAVPQSDDVGHDDSLLPEAPLHDTSVFEYVRSLFRTSLADNWPRYKLVVPHTTGFRQYLVGKPVFVSQVMFGRGTRGYVALDCQTGRFVWLKDTWRTSYIFADREGDILQRLNEAGIDNIPTLVCHGDVRDQVTIASNWIGHPRPAPSHAAGPAATLSPPSHTHSTSGTPGSRKRKREADADGDHAGHHVGERSSDGTIRSNGPLPQHKHYRIVVEEVCIPLRRFENSRQLVSITLDCLRAHFQAATNHKTRLLHRDISSGNLLILPKVTRGSKDMTPSVAYTGILSDWEMSKPVDGDAGSRTAQAIRMGTYQFMSVNALQRPSHSVTIVDELESFFHVLLYFCVRFLRSTCKDPTSWIDNYFHQYSGPDYGFTCGQKSIAMEVTGKLRTLPPQRPLLFESPLDGVFSTLLPCFKARYKVLSYEIMKATVPSPVPEVPEPPRSPSAHEILIVPMRNRKLTESAIALREEVQKEFAEWTPYDDETPSAEEQELAAKVADHMFMLDLLERVLRDASWPEDDRILPAQPLSPAEKPMVPEGPPQAAEPAPPRKRQKRAAPTRNATFPAAAPTSMRRTRSQARNVPVATRSKS
ncbi:hypothetical protein BD309DRAFT_481030 [Dichomitus squalens]|uniref:Fungal-type protein kinase domain-containing protein n=1 Tax=Dichomitus squalens TaxID=114155 RepID=A0A4Q9NCZ4_9APHY|nr:hypothetical protein BD309DRAFT_481030 [Dichomitus squalens]TBU56994.1 hypothetical protein BD310DRAFT_589436 [Dichomitus squalens]